MVDRLTCLLCPVGCELVVRRAGGEALFAPDLSWASTTKAAPRANPGAPTDPVDSVVKDDLVVADAIEVSGHQCDKGVGFAEEEILRPKRNLATSIPARAEAGAAGTLPARAEAGAAGTLPARAEAGAAGTLPARGTASLLISVRLSARVPRETIFPILAEIAKLRPALPVRRGQVLIANVLGTGVDVIATRTVE